MKEGSVKDEIQSMDAYISFPVKDMESFLKHKKYYEKNYNERYPFDWEDFKIKS